jgi:transposase
MTQAYYTDLTQSQWDWIEPLIPSAKPGGRPRTTDMMAVTRAIFYVACTGGQWR